MIRLRSKLRLVLLAIVCATVFPASAIAQVEIESKAMKIKLAGRVNAMWDYSSAAEELTSVFLIRRARITVEVQINDWISGKIQPDFTTGFGLENGLRLRDAYIDFVFSDPFRIRMGQFKRPFDRFELTSSSQILVIERTGFVRGADSCAGVGAVCSYSRLTERLGFADRDVGIGFGGTIAGHWVWSASVTNGQIFEDIVTFSGLTDTTDVFSDGKSFGGRLEYRASNLRIGANVSGHDYANTVRLEQVDYGFGYGADLDWGSYDGPGWHFKAGITAGDNWRNLDNVGNPSNFWTTQGIVAYRWGITDSKYLEGVEVLGRASYADPDTGSGDDQGVLLTPGFVTYFSGRNKAAINADIYRPGSRDWQYSVKLMTYLYF